MRSCQLSQCITAHANRDSHRAGTKRNHFVPRCVIKQWSHPPSWPGQRGMEWFGKPVFHCGWDYCAFLHYMWKGETQKDRECNLESKMNYLSSCRGKHLSSAVIPPSRSYISQNVMENMLFRITLIGHKPLESSATYDCLLITDHNSTVSQTFICQATINPGLACRALDLVKNSGVGIWQLYLPKHYSDIHIMCFIVNI